MTESMQGLPDTIIEPLLGHYKKVHPDDAAGVRAAVEVMAKDK